jgi:hypothetical protein
MLFFNSPAVTNVARRWDEVLLRHPLLQPQAWLLQIELRRRDVDPGLSKRKRPHAVA